MSMACALPFVLLTFYGWHFTAAALTIFHDMLDRLDGLAQGRIQQNGAFCDDSRRPRLRAGFPRRQERRVARPENYVVLEP